MEKLKNKRIIIILPKFFGYEDYIYREFSKYCSDVNIIYENLDELNYLYRLLYAYLPKYKKNIQRKYYISKLKKKIKNADIILVIRGSSITEDVMNYMKLEAPSQCKFCLYQWDSVQNNPEIKKIHHMFDIVSTFDLNDARKYKWKYRPLFFIPEILNNKDKTIDVFFIASLHSKRVEILNEVKEITKKNGLSVRTFLFSKRLVFYKRKYINKKEEYCNSVNKDILFKPISVKESYSFYSDSKIVVDYTHPNQKGLTMRTIECLGNKCKLVTNNKYVREADFYNENNIFIYDENNFDIPKDFINKPYENIDKNIVDSYTIQKWIMDIIGG